MTDADLDSLTRTVLWGGFVLSALFGVVAQRTRFCTMGAVADIVSMGDWTRMRLWVAAIAVATLGFAAMAGAGWVEARESIYGGARLHWLSALAGGLLFGFGMVLGSGCGSRSVVRLAGGNLKSLVVLLAIGLAALATLRGVTAVARVASVDRVAIDLPASQDLPSLVALATGWPVTRLAPLLGGAVALLLAGWVLAAPEGRSARLWLAALGIGGAIAGLFWVSGRLGYVPEHPQTLEPVFVATNSRRMEALSMVAPVGFALDGLLYFSDASKRMSFGIATLLGLFSGAALGAALTRSFRWDGFAGVEDTANHLVGGTLMGVGGVTALGCTIGQGLSGVSTLALGSFIALAGMLAGAWLAMRYQLWRIERSG